MKIRKHNYFGIDHVGVKKKFEGNPEYCNDIEIKGRTWAVYSVKNPNRTKGHKDFLLLTIDRVVEGVIISGMDKTTIENYRRIVAIHCLRCDEAIYSPHRHSMVNCECKSVAIDGGSEYSRLLYQPGDIMHKMVTLDVLTDTEIPEVLI